MSPMHVTLKAGVMLHQFVFHLICREGGFLSARFHVPHDQRLLLIGHHPVPFGRNDVNSKIAEVAAGKDMKSGT